jgi:hypothetical protein
MNVTVRIRIVPVDSSSEQKPTTLIKTWQSINASPFWTIEQRGSRGIIEIPVFPSVGGLFRLKDTGLNGIEIDLKLKSQSIVGNDMLLVFSKETVYRRNESGGDAVFLGLEDIDLIVGLIDQDWRREE